MNIDLNADAGESFGAFRMGRDLELFEFISTVNVACGFHAGDPLTMQATLELAKQKNVAVGAHPGYQDLVGFGRRILRQLPNRFMRIRCIRWLHWLVLPHLRVSNSVMSKPTEHFRLELGHTRPRQRLWLEQQKLLTQTCH